MIIGHWLSNLPVDYQKTLWLSWLSKKKLVDYQMIIKKGGDNQNDYQNDYQILCVDSIAMLWWFNLNYKS